MFLPNQIRAQSSSIWWNEGNRWNYSHLLESICLKWLQEMPTTLLQPNVSWFVLKVLPYLTETNQLSSLAQFQIWKGGRRLDHLAQQRLNVCGKPMCLLLWPWWWALTLFSECVLKILIVHMLAVFSTLRMVKCSKTHSVTGWDRCHQLRIIQHYKSTH